MTQSTKDIRPIIKALRSKKDASLPHIIEALELLALHIDNDFILLEGMIRAKRKTWWGRVCGKIKRSMM